ncbi:Diacylglycerol glucosyltransferase, N-terminal [Cynara cardunculus var. scolymus]|uniref:monogalactosyldiacylglycerol synthase n=1 Tax=Cynara cardunculus var. scolymus TaxID=59895 RepID=A0A118JU02_CYNCS|nr:Diacylglycerol glucosyltransferase, N-terminal [Cynara cardunculus var. scolymus]
MTTTAHGTHNTITTTSRLDGYSSIVSNFVHYDRKAGDFWSGGGRRKSSSKVVASLSSGSRGGSSSINKFFNEFNKFVRFHCDRIPLGFGSIKLSSENICGLGEGNGGVLEDETLPLSGFESNGKKKVLILMSDTGGGHRASAEAIKWAFNEKFGDEYEVFVTDLWTDHTPWPFNQLPRSYNFLVKHGSLWRMTYYASAPRVRGCERSYEVPARYYHQCTSSNATCTSSHLEVKGCYCPTEEVAKRALKAGLQSSQIKVYGLPVRPSFVKPIRPKDELRRELGMDEDLPAVLLMGGGEGMGPIEATAKALGNALFDENLGEPIGQVLVICGRNKKLANKLLSTEWKIPIQVKGFVTKMEECMGACDCIITKAGPGTIAEAMIRGLPIILNDYIAGQSPKEIAHIVGQWFGPRAHELQAMSQNALRLARPDSVFKIVQDLHELVKQRSLIMQYSTAT